jgi:hypothetical protein
MIAKLHQLIWTFKVNLHWGSFLNYLQQKHKLQLPEVKREMILFVVSLTKNTRKNIYLWLLLLLALLLMVMLGFDNVNELLGALTLVSFAASALPERPATISRCGCTCLCCSGSVETNIWSHVSLIKEPRKYSYLSLLLLLAFLLMAMLMLGTLIV